MSVTSKRAVVLLLVVVLALSTMPGFAAAESRSGGTIIIPADETVTGDLEAYGGTVVIHGTVTGDVEVFAGNVVIDGEVGGSVEAFAGNVAIDGDIGGDVETFAGNVEIGPDATIGGTLGAAGGTVVLLGSVDGDAELAGGTVRLGPTASIGGSLTYDTEEFVRDEGATVGGAVQQTSDLSTGPPFPDGRVPAGLRGGFVVYGFFVNLVFGVVLLLVFPGFSRVVADRAVADPLRSSGIGLLALVAVPVALVLVAITIVGIPLSIVGAVLFAIAAWIGAIYGRFAVGTWLLSLTDYENRWASLLVGLIAVALVARIPVVGWLVSVVVFLLGLGALAHVLYVRYRGGSGDATEPVEGPEPTDGDEGARPV